MPRIKQVGFNPYKRGRPTKTIYKQNKNMRKAYYGPIRTGGFYGPSRRPKQEKKVIDTPKADYNLYTTASVALINGVATGTDFNQRIGRRTQVKSIQIRGFATPTTANTSGAVTQGNLCRVMVIEDKQTNGVLPAITDILDNSTATSMMNLNNRERFKVHLDEQFALGPCMYTSSTWAFGAPSVHSINFYKRCDIPVYYEGTAATIGSISSGALYLVTVGENGDATNLFQAEVRVRFVDA